MLTDMQIAVLGGDARQLEIVKRLAELDAKLYLIGFEQLAQVISGAVKEKLKDVDFSKIDAVILPVKGTNLDGEVETIFSNENIILTEQTLQETPSHCKIYSGISNPYLDKLVKKADRELIQLFKRDDVAIYNSIPTVEGTVMMAIQNTDITIHQSSVAVLGLGRVGMSVARTFSLLGANVKVGARSLAHLARITEMGLKPFHLENLKDEVKDLDICINTIPHLVLTAGIIAGMPTNTLIIDLASKPGGTDFRYAEKRGVKALLAPSLPGIVAPKTAGQILANILSQLLSEDFENRKENS
ncbi:dipicolinic acid synthetase subunit A [Lederbergia sp. NSJ-179]|uniref:dipicolinic acid synthetase subunit A n=1 Tax=Lederbergia sp. NSJ-179 TaxID=2931402 RepID=UPI001FD27B0D|nr:dipicolinic acid synthetase subunit A [Lederbergia sp. NSJ-179]MCJ7839690.1 dipicolinic acid synthetase subunit A [Lederbergia sp. NSJ-179]